MLLTAHRVVHPDTHDEGINSFFYRHGPCVWDSLPPPEVFSGENPGELFESHVEIPPPGNRVRSFLDVVAPDETTEHEIRRAVGIFLERSHAAPLPWEGVVGRCLFRIGMESELAAAWRQEVASLYRKLTDLRAHVHQGAGLPRWAAP